ncbi:MAG TPA: 2OG-Fe(II) oxygenase [Terriglobales bacterium]|nr:2OG-Fe(II) oxygenase [Terriglobales bacterium]
MAVQPGIALSETARFPYEKWGPQLPVLSRIYRENAPFPHIQLQQFVDPEIALAAAEEFPRSDTPAWIQYKHQNENKQGMPKRERFPRLLGELTDELNSPEFCRWLSELTGIRNLLSDASLEGGGLHQSSRGGFLNVHTDFSKHHYHKHWRRRVNLVLYLNEGWREEWGGSIELWDASMRHCVARYAPILNHAVIFTTDEGSLHGFPDPLRCPPGESRKSIALYYYTEERDEHAAPHSTDYRARPEDSIGKACLIWLDKKAVDLYSRAKARFGFSDEMASRILGFLSSKK